MTNKENPIHTHSLGSIPSESVWKPIDELVESIASDAEFDSLELVSYPLDDQPVSERDLSLFYSTLRRYRVPARSSKSTLVERWAMEQSQVNWLATLSHRLNAIRTAREQAWTGIETFFESLQTTIDILSQRMVPAPAHRNASAAKEKIYQPRRRALEPADLPSFPSLFCTAVDPDEPPFVISGLTPGVSHRFSLTCVQDPTLSKEQILVASDQGKVELGIASLLESLQKIRGEFGEFVWFLQEEKDGGAWTSGLVWLESKATHKLAKDAIRVLRESEDSERADSCIDALFEINLLSTREFLMKAYEEARQGLLFLPRQYREENSVPFKESLWLFTNQLVDKILFRLERAEPVFRQIKAEWNAVGSLRKLKERLKEWE